MESVSAVKKDQCCGCSACKSICPVSAIKMISDEKGFLYPIVDNLKCIKCGICFLVCQNAKNIKYRTILSYAAKNKDDRIREKSSSGGISYELCKAMINKDGICYGVTYDSEFRVVTRRASTLEECELFYGSKYVAVNTRNTFIQVEEDLCHGKPVLFFGTSCHVAGLLSYLIQKRINIARLVTIDLICHGVPSPLLFQDFIDSLGRNTLKKFEFRTKKLGWGDTDWKYGCTATFKSGKEEVNSPRVRSFYTLFSRNYILRQHCYNCEFASPEKPADITIADYWGLKNVHPEFVDSKGVSAVLVHTEKGNGFIREIKGCTFQPTSLEQIRKNQFNLNSPSKPNPNERLFWELYAKDGFKAVAKLYGDNTINNNIRYFFWKSGILDKVKKIMGRENENG